MVAAAESPRSDAFLFKETAAPTTGTPCATAATASPVPQSAAVDCCSTSCSERFVGSTETAKPSPSSFFAGEDKSTSATSFNFLYTPSLLSAPAAPSLERALVNLLAMTPAHVLGLLPQFLRLGHLALSSSSIRSQKAASTWMVPYFANIHCQTKLAMCSVEFMPLAGIGFSLEALTSWNKFSGNVSCCSLSGPSSRPRGGRSLCESNFFWLIADEGAWPRRLQVSRATEVPIGDVNANGGALFAVRYSHSASL